MVGLTSFSVPTEGIRHQQPSTTLIVNGRDVGIGTLYIAESVLTWKNNTSGDGISLPYTQICIHAVSRDLERFEHECLYVITDRKFENDSMVVDEEEEESDDEGEDRMPEANELRFVPADKGALDAMYVAMNHCQALNPDPEGFVLSEDEDDEEEEDEFLDAHEGGGILPEVDSGYVDENFPDFSNRPNGFHRVAENDEDLDSAIEIDPGQFEDAED